VLTRRETWHGTRLAFGRSEWLIPADCRRRLDASSTRKPEMKSYALPKDDLDALVAYMVSLKKK
jgi:hypothetical protein